MDIKETFRKIFEKGNPGLGWFVLWRLWLALIPLNIISTLLAAQAGPNPAAGVGAIFALPIGGNYYLVPIAVPLVLILWNWIGKMAMRKKLGINTRRFVGWALYWRFALFQLAGLLALGLVTVPLVFLAQVAGETGAIIIMSLVALIGLPALIYWNLNVIGFVVKRVAAMGPAEAALDAAASAAPESGAPVRDYRQIFDEKRFGMNWMFAGAYIATGLVGMLVFPLVQALLSGEFYFGAAPILHSILIGLVIGGVGLTFLLQRLREAFLVVLLFALLMVVTQVLVETPLIALTDGSFGEMSLFHPAAMLARLTFAALYCAGILAGIHFRGPTFIGLALGILAGQLANGLILNPLIWIAIENVPAAVFYSVEGIFGQLLGNAIDAAIAGFALWWALNWHLGQHGLRLSPEGAIVPRDDGPAQPGGPTPADDRWDKYGSGN